MTRLFIAFLIFPALLFAQVKKPKQPVSKVPVTKEPQLTRPIDGYLITGYIKGLADGVAVNIINQQSGAAEQKAIINKEKFAFTGKMEPPGFVQLAFAGENSSIPLFLDNSNVKIIGSKDALDKVTVSGSPSHFQYITYTNAIKPYEGVFDPNIEHYPADVAKVQKVSEDFIKQYPTSYVTALAIIRLYQATENGPRMEQLFATVPQYVQTSPMGAYINQLIQESRINPIGSVMADFSQEDQNGKPLSIKAYRGKYVLVDFWASWCRPCRMENPNVVAAYDKYKGKNFTVLGVSLDQAKQNWIDAIKTDNLTWGHVSDLKGWGNAVAAQFQVRAIPQNFLLDPEGRIIGKNLRGMVLERKLASVLK